MVEIVRLSLEGQRGSGQYDSLKGGAAFHPAFTCHSNVMVLGHGARIADLCLALSHICLYIMRTCGPLSVLGLEDHPGCRKKRFRSLVSLEPQQRTQNGVDSTTKWFVCITRPRTEAS